MCWFEPELTQATALDLPRLLEVWEASVRATHTFLGAADLQKLRPLVEAALPRFPVIHCLRDPSGEAFAFLVVQGAKIEMLFIHAGHRGQGAGRRLLNFAITELGARFVDVNEQNHQALGFYRHLGFRRFSRSELDPYGDPFPILHLELRHGL